MNGSDAIASSRELPLLGRGRELGELMAAFDEARAGRGGLVLLTGEPGIGKTRLARTLGDQARAAGAAVALARGWDGGGAPSYWPWLQVVRALAAERTDERLAADLGAGARWVAQIAPEIRERVGLPEARRGRRRVRAGPLRALRRRRDVPAPRRRRRARRRAPRRPPHRRPAVAAAARVPRARGRRRAGARRLHPPRRGPEPRARGRGRLRRAQPLRPARATSAASRRPTCAGSSRTAAARTRPTTSSRRLARGHRGQPVLQRRGRAAARLPRRASRPARGCRCPTASATRSAAACSR